MKELHGKTELIFKQNSGEVKCRPQIKLLEFDERFSVFKEFVPYDFEKTFKLPPELKGTFDAIICDPPFLSQDCQTKGKISTPTVTNHRAYLTTTT